MRFIQGCCLQVWFFRRALISGYSCARGHRVGDWCRRGLATVRRPGTVRRVSCDSVADPPWRLPPPRSSLHEDVSGDTINRWRIRVGSSYANSGGLVHTVIAIIVHPKYNSRTIDNDVAILRTTGSIIFGPVVKPAAISGNGYILEDNEEVWAAGWGTTSAGGLLSEQLRHVQLWTVNQVICRSRYATRAANITDNMLCSGVLDVGGRDQCQGDSGGPLYHNNVVVGICSWGISCATPQYPGVNTRVSRFADWIVANANTILG